MFKIINNDKYEKRQEILTDLEKQELLIEVMITNGNLNNKNVIFIGRKYNIIENKNF